MKSLLTEMSELNLSSKQINIGVYKIDNTKKTLKWCMFLLIYNFFSLQEILSRYKVFRDYYED